MWKQYESKPIVRTAFEITDEFTITYIEKDSEVYIISRRTNDTIKAKCYEKPKHGDYIYKLNEDDIYHCNKTVFEERNIVEK